ncbi:MAG: hypothetical protein M4579_001251 [Chaenotheca gracillima]|nr:MAG: hypothetical protein M4579_001251 [Chaenotheca gracillima]
MPKFLDDKSEHCIPFIVEQIQAHRHGQANPTPFFLGLNGVQGAGKTTLVSALCTTLSSPPHSLPTTVLSVDDLYLPHTALKALSASHPSNPLLRHRGVPPTHDVSLGVSVFSSIRDRKPTAIPAYDKSAYSGQGDRTDPATWEKINQPGQPPVEVVIFEGWCVGFRALKEEELRRKWEEARQSGEASSQLRVNRYEDVKFVNEALAGYDALTDCLDALIHIDAEDLTYVYAWRLDQERALRASKGSGMTDEQVKEFVDGYYPCYELYTSALRRPAAFVSGDEKRRMQKRPQLRLVVGRDRAVKTVESV